MKHHEVPKSKYPVCGAKNELATSVVGDPNPPTEGDLTVCLDCGAMLGFGPKMSLVELSIADLDRVRESDPRVYETLLMTSAAALKLSRTK